VRATGSGLTDFVLTEACEAARRVLADRVQFALSPAALAEWEAINRRPARRPPGPPGVDEAAFSISQVKPGYRPPELLSEQHRVEAFECRSAEQTSWLRRFARQSASTGTTRVFVVTPDGRPDVVAYYAWCMAQVAPSAAPQRLSKGAGRYPQPVALLARLGVDVPHEGNGLGAGLLQDVFKRLLALSDDVGCRGLLIHAESAAARDFYRHLVPELEASPTDPLHQVLLLKDLRRALLR
jgi:hypothetical protein